jgi:hypothetical protein
LQQHPAFEEAGGRVAVVTFEAAPRAQAYAAETSLAWPILLDHDRALYRRYGMSRGRLADIWGPATLWAYAKELAHGNLPRWSGADPRQLGGDVLIDPEGIVRLHHVGSGPADRPPIAAILAAMAAPR